MTTSNYKLRTAHYMTQLGVPKEIVRRKALAGRELAVIEFEPKAPGDNWRYVTNGMSEHKQIADAAVVRTELLATALSAHPWIVELLDSLCRYPIQNNTYFTQFDIVPVNRPIDRETSSFTAILLCPWSTTDLDSAQSMWGLFREPVDILNVVGIFESESTFASKAGGKSLFDRLLHGGSWCLDVQRKPVI